MPHRPIALLTERRYLAATAAPDDWYLANILQDDALLQTALAQHGFTAVRVDWADPTVDWTQFAGAVFRTTWDYFDRPTEFTAWFQRAQRQTQLCNPPAIITWNMDKHYLADLAAWGIPTVPSRFIERGHPLPLPALLAASGWAEAIIKPCVSGAARHTYRINAQNVATVAAMVQPLLTTEAFILQPFQAEILQTGEDTLMVLNGQYSHAVRKKPKPGDFRVQDDYGGTVEVYTPTSAQIALAERAMAACAPRPAYGRVDMVRDAQGQWVIMELELIEPELWLRYHPPAATAMAAALVALLEQGAAL